jgi:hypothetical protein
MPVGHQHLGTLPSSKKWREVVALIRSGADVQHVASATSSAAEQQMIDEGDDPAVKRAFWLLTQIPSAAKKESFAEELRKLGMDVPDRPTLVIIAMAMNQAIDQHVAGVGGRTDLGEMAQLAAIAADEFVAGLLPIIQAIRSTGAVTLRDMASALNQRGIRSARGGKWHVSSVLNLLARSSAIPSTPALS